MQILALLFHARRSPRLLTTLGGACAVALLAVGCKSELGPCDTEAARELVYSRDGMVATKGQALMHDSCGGAAFCHARGAEKAARLGAPAGMDFDMLPRPMGWPAVVSERELLWEVVAGGSMPPDGVGRDVLGRGGWSFDKDRKDERRLPGLATRDGKAAFRNWLACGAPVVADTGIPSWALPPRGTDGGTVDDWHGIFTQIIEPRCATAGCHNTPTAGGLVLLEECAAHDALLATGRCEGLARVVPGDGGSYLLDKLEHTEPRCGAPMPPAGALAADELAAIRSWVEEGAAAPACD